ncbi:hypothetical protein [Microbacterium abyssi]|uniref:hypothetical protein n=1 Tax=Microbacterium abyssi TaxID=2782166 RepID=UPI00188944BD|nr:hypothetical protein [Microbacterium sp. A18JL241]
MRSRLAAVCGILILALTACSAAPGNAGSPSSDTGDGHGEIAGAHELAEPALHLTTIDAEGTVHHLDLLDEGQSVLAGIEPIDDLVSDGRYLFGIREGSVTVIDSGVWTWSHIDHFHYYEAPAKVIGEITGPGSAAVVPGEVGVGMLFEGEAVLIETPALADGEIVESFRIPVDAHDGLVVPLTQGAAVTEPDATGAVQALRMIAADGTTGESVACAAAAGTIITVVGTVVGCADGAVLSVGGDPGEWERIAYPADAAAQAHQRAMSFAARKSRPTVAALAGDTGFWLLDTRERTWSLHDIGEELVQVAAVDDDASRVLALTADGAVLILSDGEITARTEPLVAASLDDPGLAAGVTFVVDQNRAYLNGPAEQTMWEIDPADGARISRTFETGAAPLHLAGTGR